MAKRLVVVGNGMVGQRFLEDFAQGGAALGWKVTVFGEETRPAYDRVRLSSYFDGATAEDLSLANPELTSSFDMRFGERITAVDRRSRTVTTMTPGGEVDVTYDTLILATGSYPFVPPLPGSTGSGCFVYRTLDDLDAIASAAATSANRAGIVIGGGLLGLEAANALLNLGLETHVVEIAPHLMPVQVDAGGGTVLRSEIEKLGIAVHTGASSTRIRRSGRRVAGLQLDDGTVLRADLVVFSAGIRPRDELARACGLDVGEKGGVVVDDMCRTSDPRIHAIGECALHRGRIYGLAAPGYAMARVVATRLSGGDATFGGADMSAKLKLLGVDVASFGDAHGAGEGAREVVWHNPLGGIHRKIVTDESGSRLLGGILVGDAGDYSILSQMCASRTPITGDPADLVMPGRSARAPGADSIAGDATICNCNNVTKDAIRLAVTGQSLTTVAEVKSCTRAGTTCGSCVPLIKALVDDELSRAGIEVDRSLCEHFPHTRQELFDIVRVRRITTFAELLEGWGRGRGCEVCKPAVASILASQWNDYVLADGHAALQDTNDAFLANLQKDGSYSVVPRVPGGEITPRQLIVLGEVAEEFDLYTKITGGQRVDLFGARVDQLPSIWKKLIDAGFESGHAYGKALRTVKSCIGSTWCRYGVQDSTALAIELELRYRGLRAPHKIKSAVSGCARECAEAQGKDFGVIATEQGWNLFVCGNGGMRPQHAVMLAGDLDTGTLIRYVDRFLMFYIRTADRLERTATWFNKLEGGIDYLRAVVIDDSLGLCADLEDAMARHIAGYECEWKATVEDADRLRRFRRFVNTDGVGDDPTLAYVRDRGQKRPVRRDEIVPAQPVSLERHKPVRSDLVGSGA